MKTTVGLFGAVLRHVTQHYEIPAARILSEQKGGTISEARWFCCWLMRAEGMTFAEIGRLLGIDHSTVINAVQQLNRRRGADVHVSGRLLQLQRAIRIELAPCVPELTANGWGMVCGEIGYSFGETVKCVSRETVAA